jgi:transcriptional regulator with XRE-family HTH domain
MTPQELGERIKEARLHRELNQSELAEKIGIAQRALSDIERGERKLTVLELMDLIQVMELPLAYFLSNEASEITNLESVIVEEFRLLPNDESRWLAINVVRAIRKSTPIEKADSQQ